MKAVVRKSLRLIVEELKELRDACEFQYEKDEIDAARVRLVRADYFDAHVKPNFKYVEPKSDFDFKCHESS